MQQLFLATACHLVYLIREFSVLRIVSALEFSFLENHTIVNEMENNCKTPITFFLLHRFLIDLMLENASYASPKLIASFV